MNNILENIDSLKFREWLKENHNKEKECWIKGLKRGNPENIGIFYYIDAVEVALCFGWIDSTYKKIDGVLYQRFSPRSKNSSWTILNIERCKRLKDLGLMEERGWNLVPKEEFIFNKKIIDDIKTNGIYDQFIKFPLLYQKIKVSNLESLLNKDKEKYETSLNNLVNKTKQNKTVGEWNDYGRLK